MTIFSRNFKANFIERMDESFKERILKVNWRKELERECKISARFSVGKIVYRLRDRVVNCYAFIRFWRALPSMM